jgi:hypothetical protein
MTEIDTAVPMPPAPRPPGGELPAALGERDPAYIRRSPAYIRRSLRFTWPLIAAWFHPEIRGLDRIPAGGPDLLVGNHSGGNVAPDTLALTIAFYRHFGVERPFFQLAHHLVMRAPWLSLLHKYGTIEASWENAQAAFDREAAVLVYPGVTGRRTVRLGTVAALSSPGAKDSSVWRSTPGCPSSRWSRSEARKRRCS